MAPYPGGGDFLWLYLIDGYIMAVALLLSI